MCHLTNIKNAYNSTSKDYDFSNVFKNIKDYTLNADITVGNLETTFAGASRGYTGYPTFNTPEVLGKNLRDIGFDVICTANNHSMDKGYSGIESTLDFLDEYGLDHYGTARSEQEQDTILIKDVNGIKIAFLAYTYGTNGITIPSGKEYSVNLIDKDLIKEHISLAKQQNVDMICVNMHWGNEYKVVQNSTQEDLANLLNSLGVDIIVGSHSHNMQPIKWIGNSNKTLVYYSLGNFVSADEDISRTGETFDNAYQVGLLSQLEVRKDNNDITISWGYRMDFILAYSYFLTFWLAW